MPLTKEQLRTAKLNGIVKRFRASIVFGFSARIPDKVIDSLNDEEAKELIQLLNNHPLLVKEHNGMYSRK